MTDADGRSSSFGESGDVTVVDRFGVWLSKRQINRVVGTLVGKDVGDIGCGYEADFMRRTLGEVRTATLVDVSLAPDLAEQPKVRAIEGLLPGAMDAIDDSSLDVVLCMSVVEHLWEPEQTLEHFHRVLRPGGVAAVNVPSWLGKRALEYSAFRLGLSPAEEMDDHKMYYDPKDLWPLMVKAGFMPARHQVLQAQVRPQHLRGRHPFTGDTFIMSMTFTESFLRETVDLVQNLDTEQIERMATGIAEVRERGGRLFILGVGGSAGSASHAVNDFRKICEVESYSPIDNVSELTARANDEGWDTTFAAWLHGSRLDSDDAVLVFSVGGGNAEKKVSTNIVAALDLAKERGAASTASSVATAGTPPSWPTRARSSRRVRRPHHPAHRGAVLRDLAPAGQPPGAGPRGDQVGVGRMTRTGVPAGPNTGLLHRTCVVGGAGFIGGHFVARLLVRPGDRAGHRLRQLHLRQRLAPRAASRTTRG